MGLKAASHEDNVKEKTHALGFCRKAPSVEHKFDPAIDDNNLTLV